MDRLDEFRRYLHKCSCLYLSYENNRTLNDRYPFSFSGDYRPLPCLNSTTDYSEKSMNFNLNGYEISDDNTLYASLKKTGFYNSSVLFWRGDTGLDSKIMIANRYGSLFISYGYKMFIEESVEEGRELFYAKEDLESMDGIFPDTIYSPCMFYLCTHKDYTSTHSVTPYDDIHKYVTLIIDVDIYNFVMGYLSNEHKHFKAIQKYLSYFEDYCEIKFERYVYRNYTPIEADKLFIEKSFHKNDRYHNKKVVASTLIKSAN